MEFVSAQSKNSTEGNWSYEKKVKSMLRKQKSKINKIKTVSDRDFILNVLVIMREKIGI